MIQVVSDIFLRGPVSVRAHNQNIFHTRCPTGTWLVILVPALVLITNTEMQHKFMILIEWQRHRTAFLPCEYIHAVSFDVSSIIDEHKQPSQILSCNTRGNEILLATANPKWNNLVSKILDTLIIP